MIELKDQWRRGDIQATVLIIGAIPSLQGQKEP